MPKMDGFALISRIRTDRGSPHLHSLPIIVVTTLEDANAKLRALLSGANDFITKNTETAELQARVMARYKLAKSLKEREWRQLAGRNHSPAMPPKPAQTSETLPAKNTSTMSKSPAKTSVQNNPAQGQQSPTRKFVVPETPAPGRFSVDKLDRTGAVAPEGSSRLYSSTSITLTATLVVALIVAGIFYRRSDTEVAREPDNVRAEAPAENRVEGDQQQTLSTKIAPVELQNTTNGSSLAGDPQNVARGVITETNDAAPKEQEQSAKPAQDASPEKVQPLRSDKSAIPAEPAAPKTRTKRQSRTAPAVVAQTHTPPKEQTGGHCSRLRSRPHDRGAGTIAEGANPAGSTESGWHHGR
jgi:CheY-like chemotaxis protein